MRRALCPLLLLLSSAAVADPHPMLMGADPQPEAEQQIRMSREDLRIKIGLDAVEVEADFTFDNPGEARRLRVIGFPCVPGKAFDASLTCETPLKVWVNDKPLAPKRLRRKPAKGEGAPEDFLSWRMAFPAKQQVKLRLAYEARVINERYSVPLGGISYMRYRLATGALWAGPIGELNIDVETPIDALILIRPEGYQRTPGRITWRLKEHEPKGDLLLGFPFMLASRNLRAYGEGAEGIRAGVAAGRLDPARLSKVIEGLKRGGMRYGEFLAMQARYLADPKPEPPTPWEVERVTRESVRILQKRVAAQQKPMSRPTEAELD